MPAIDVAERIPKQRKPPDVVQKASNSDITSNKRDGIIAPSSTTTSASAAFARSFFLFMSTSRAVGIMAGIMFRRPSKLFRPNRGYTLSEELRAVDTWASLRHLANSAEQTLSPSFIRNLLRKKSGVIALTIALIPPLAINTTLGFLLFTSHSLFSLSLAKLPFFRREVPSEEHINLHNLLMGPSVIPKHPTFLSALAGGGAGIVQGLAFTPIENIVRFIQQSTTSVAATTARFLRITNPVIVTDETPFQALKTLFAGESWRKSSSWWTGWRWSVSRDAVTYAVFFAAFDVTRRIGLRVKALFGGHIDGEWRNFFIISGDPFSNHSYTEAPTKARVAQAGTIVLGGVLASWMAEIAGRPFKACQKIMQNRTNASRILDGQTSLGSRSSSIRPILEVLQTQGIRSFFRPEAGPIPKGAESRAVRLATRFGWRMAAVGPWGAAFLVWAWVGGEI